jgi:hypothetical protein
MRKMLLIATATLAIMLAAAIFAAPGSALGSDMAKSAGTSATVTSTPARPPWPGGVRRNEGSLQQLDGELARSQPGQASGRPSISAGSRCLASDSPVIILRKDLLHEWLYSSCAESEL